MSRCKINVRSSRSPSTLTALRMLRIHQKMLGCFLNDFSQQTILLEKKDIDFAIFLLAQRPELFLVAVSTWIVKFSLSVTPKVRALILSSNNDMSQEASVK